MYFVNYPSIAYHTSTSFCAVPHRQLIIDIDIEFALPFLVQVKDGPFHAIWTDLSCGPTCQSTIGDRVCYQY